MEYRLNKIPSQVESPPQNESDPDKAKEQLPMRNKEQ